MAKRNKGKDERFNILVLYYYFSQRMTCIKDGFYPMLYYIDKHYKGNGRTRKGQRGGRRSGKSKSTSLMRTWNYFKNRRGK